MMKPRRLYLHPDEIRLIYAGRRTQMRVPVKIKDWHTRQGIDGIEFEYAMVDLKHPYATYLTPAKGLCWIPTGGKKVEPIPVDKLQGFQPFGKEILVLEKARLNNISGYQGVNEHFELLYDVRDHHRSLTRDFSFSVLGKSSYPYQYKFETFTSPVCMPSWAVRLKLRVEEAKVEKLKDISWEDMEAEGIQGFEKYTGQACYTWFGVWQGNSPNRISAYYNFWNRIRPKSPWDKTDWVWRIQFTPEFL